jgi:large subunit ribosomal protein L21
LTLDFLRAPIGADMAAVDRVLRASLASDVVLIRQVAEYIIGGGGKQYKGAPGEKLHVEQIPADVGAEVILDQVLMIGEGESVRLGQPTVAGATVKATVVSQGRGEKVKIFKMRRRKHYQKHQGHRQNYTELQIDAIVG